VKIFRKITEEWSVIGPLTDALAAIAARHAELAPELTPRISLEESEWRSSDGSDAAPQSQWTIRITYTTWTQTA
jgi:hypothetical protein